VIYTKTTSPLLLPLNDFHYHFKGDSNKIKKNSARHEESRAQHCQRPEIIYAGANHTSDSGLTKAEKTVLSLVAFSSPQIGTYTETSAVIFLNKYIPGFFNILTRTTSYVKL
jgi:hypothetical protein